MMRRAFALTVLAAATVCLVRAAGALFHLAVIDEVATSYNGDPTAQFIEVRILGGTQNLLTHSVFAAFDTSGAYIGDILEVPGNVANSGPGVRWIVATSAFQTASGLTPDFAMPSGILPTGGGMVCYGGGGGAVPQNPPTWDRTNFANYVDCVAYGTYSGSTNALIGTPTSLDGDGHSLQRIGNTHNNASDFSCGDPLTPENNAGMSVSLPATTPCPGCPSAADLSCVSDFAKGTLLIKETGGKEKLLVKMVGGSALTQTDLGNPLDPGGTAYRLCLYNDTSALVGQLLVDKAGDTCGTAPCWKALGGDPPGGKGYKYKDDTLAANGVAKIIYKGNPSKALVKGRGGNLPSGVTSALQSATSATVQLRGSDAPQCLSLTVTDIKKQEADFFKGKK